jgi:hypothetical protein
MKKERDPWNPYPLAVLKVEGISRGAAHVLTVLGARSNYKGETCVGHRGLVKDCKSSKQYVTDALKELYDKGIVKKSERVRHKSQADWKTINPSILTSRITEAGDQSYPVGQSNPTQQDFDSPTQQGRTLQIRTTPNLADENLADSKEGRKEGTISSPEPELEKVEPLKFESEEQQERAKDIAKAWHHHTGFAFGTAEDWRAAADLLGGADVNDFNEIIGYINDTFACPKTAKVLWRDFPYWVQQSSLTTRNIDAWRRLKKAKIATAG